MSELNQIAYQAWVRTCFVDTFEVSEEAFAEQEETWKEWCDLKRHMNARKLLDYLSAGYTDVYKARALCILLAPNEGWSPFYWAESTKDNTQVLHLIKPEEFSEKLLAFCAHLTWYNLCHIKKANPSRAESYVYFLIRLLEYLRGEELTHRILDVLPVSDLVRVSPDPWDLETSPSSLKLFWAFMNARVPEEWKRRQDQSVRDLIRAELSDPQHPKLTSNDAYPSYMNGLNLYLYRKSPTYSMELFASQVDFVLGFELPGQKRFGKHNVTKMFYRLGGTNRLALRRRLIRDALITDHGPFEVFTVVDQEDFRMLKQAMEEVDLSDSLLYSRLAELIREAHPRILEQCQMTRDETQRADRIDEKMRM